MKVGGRCSPWLKTTVKSDIDNLIDSRSTKRRMAIRKIEEMERQNVLRWLWSQLFCPLVFPDRLSWQRNISRCSFRSGLCVCFHLFSPFQHKKQSFFSDQTFSPQYARQGNCFCLMFMYCGKRGSPAFSGGSGEVRLMISAQRERERAQPKETEKPTGREILFFRQNNVWWRAEENRVLRGNYGNVDGVPWTHIYTHFSFCA